MDDVRARIIVDVETFKANRNNSPFQAHISESTLFDLQKLLDNVFNDDNSEDLDRLFEDLSLRNLSLNSLIRPLAYAMDSGPTHLSLFASKVYLSLIASPNAPVFTLFTPMNFLSLLRSIRRSLKNQTPSTGNEKEGRGSNLVLGRKKKFGGRARPSKNRSGENSGQVGSYEKEDGHPDVGIICTVLERLEIVIGLVHLGRFPDTLKSVIQTVAEIPVTAVEICVPYPKYYHKLIDLCSRILGQLLTSEHSDQAITAAEVLKSLSPSILLVKSEARNFALEFVKSNIITAACNSDAIKSAVVNLPRYLVHRAPEKADPRALAVESIMEIVKAMGYEHQLGFVDYLVKMSQGKTHFRLLAVDIVPLLMMSLREPLGVDPERGMENLWRICFDVLMQRCSDVNVTIRARALSNLAQLVVFFSGDNRRRDLLNKVLWYDSLEQQSSKGGINELLRKRCMDEKAAVRKSSLLLITKLTALVGDAFDTNILKLVGMACSDSLVSIRKAAILALSEVFRKFSNRNITIEWLHSVPPLISDNESSIQEECQNLFLELVLNKISRAGSSSVLRKELISSNVEATGIVPSFPEGVLGLLQEICNGEVMPWVKKICKSLGKKKCLKQNLATSLQNIIKTSESLWLDHHKTIEMWTAPLGAWFLLSEVSAYLSKAVEWDFLLHHWQLFDKQGLDSESKSPYVSVYDGMETENTEIDSLAWAGDRVYLLQTISNVSLELPPEAAADLAFNLLKRLENFNMHYTEVNAHVKALRVLCKRKVSIPGEADAVVVKWAQQLISKASKIIDKFVAKNSDANKDKNFLTPPRSGSGKAQKTSRLLAKAITACYTIGCLVIVCPSVNLKAIVPVLHAIISSGKSFNSKYNKLPAPATFIKHTSPSLCTQAWMTMGKICLADEKLVKKYIPLFLQELENSDNAVLRNNIVVIMTDFCVRYTALVDSYISRITKCLRDPCELVRRQTFILLSRLLQRDYVKWRGILFLRFLLSLVDDSEKIRQLANYLFETILKVKAPLLAYNSFVEAIYVLNGCQTPSAQINSQQSKSDDKLFCIRGNDEKSRCKRMHIYVCLLKQMAPEHLLATFAKLCADVLAAATDGFLNIQDSTGQSVLQDAFRILGCTEIRAPSSRASNPDPPDNDEENPSRRFNISQSMRKSLIQNTIPIFIELKRLLQSLNSPLTGSLMECLAQLLKDYKSEIEDILVADKQLQKELLYDIQRHENEDANHKCARTGTSAARTVMEDPTTPMLSSIGRPKLRTEKSKGKSGVSLEVLRSLKRKRDFGFGEEG